MSGGRMGHVSGGSSAIVLAALVVASACEDGAAPRGASPSPAAVHPVAPSPAPLPVAGPGGSGAEALAGIELDPFSLPAGFHSSSGPLTPSSTTLPVDETYGGAAGWAFKITQQGSGNAGWFRITSPSSMNRMALLATHTGEGIAARAINTGTGRAFWAQIPEPSNPFPALVATHVGSGEALEAIAFGSGEAIVGRSRGSGPAGVFEVDNTSSFANALDVFTDSELGGVGVFAEATGTGNAGVFRINNASSSSDALTAFTNGGPHSDAFSALTNGEGAAGRFENVNSGNPSPAVHVLTNSNISGAAALLAEASGSGIGGRFEAGTGTALAAVNNEAGNALSAIAQRGRAAFLRNLAMSDLEVLRVTNHGTGPIASFYEGLERRAVITNDGDILIDGSFIDTGADLAEEFATEDGSSAYEPGDVLAISRVRDRTVTKASEAYSDRVIGVYATKPGIILGREAVDGGSGDPVPVAITGVVPTRVTAENGPIERGDILVSSNRAGYAMKGEPLVIQGRKIFPTGAAIGKALEPFAGPGTGTILVMVNVK